jgi:hypothetical protein
MRAMSKLARVAVVGTASALCLLAFSSCGGAKKAESPGTCPEGTVLSGENCVPESAAGSKPSAESKPSGEEDSAKANTKGSGAPSAGSSGANASGDSPSGGGSIYDKEAVEAQLKRAAKQVRANCGSASDEDGAKTGPWGATTATIVLGRNGHVHEVTVPAPYSGKPVGDCVVNSFRKIQYPPFSGPSDASVTWDVQIVEPKQK